MDKKMMDFLTRLSRGLAAQFGENCEIVVHDIKPGDETISSISLIENGHVTGRKVGDGPSQAVIDALTEPWRIVFPILQKPTTEKFSGLPRYTSKMTKEGSREFFP